MRMGVNTSQIPNGIESLADWHNFYFVQKYRRDDQQPDGTVRKNTIITFPRSEESPLIFKAQAVYADSASVKKDGSIRFPQELKETGNTPAVALKKATAPVHMSWPCLCPNTQARRVHCCICTLDGTQHIAGRA